jgi:hypothetical protein
LWYYIGGQWGGREGGENKHFSNFGEREIEQEREIERERE